MDPLFEFFNRGARAVPEDRADWPESWKWKKIEYKKYPRMPQIKLPKAELPSVTLNDAILNRKSSRDFLAVPLTTAELSALIFFGAGITKENRDINFSHRAHPSGGARYPIELYPLIMNVKDLDEGIYHYNILDNSLEFLLKADREAIAGLSRFDFVRDAGALFIFTMIPSRSTIKYGNAGYKMGLIEAGHIAQNIYLAASALQLKCLALGGMANLELANDLLDIDGNKEIAFYSAALGR